MLLLEAGGSDNYHWIHIPVGYLYCISNPRTDWMLPTAPEQGLNGRALNYPRGKVLGGCSSINGMIYMRGQAATTTCWRQMGMHRLELGRRSAVLPQVGRSLSRRKRAAWRRRRVAGREARVRWAVLDAFQDGGRRKRGIPATADFNTGNNEGSGYFDVNQRSRHSLEHRQGLPASGDEAPQSPVRSPAAQVRSG